MIFDDVNLQTDYDFGKPYSKHFTKESEYYKDLSVTLEKLSGKIEEMIGRNKPVTLCCGKVLKNLTQLPSEKLKNEESRLERIKDDIYPLVAYDNPSTIQDKLRRLHVTKPEVSDHDNFVLYLKLEYLLYIMTYFVFPGERFIDLFDEKISNIENLAGVGGNGRYLFFLIISICFDSDSLTTTEELNNQYIGLINGFQLYYGNYFAKQIPVKISSDLERMQQEGKFVETDVATAYKIYVTLFHDYILKIEEQSLQFVPSEKEYAKPSPIFECIDYIEQVNFQNIEYIIENIRELMSHPKRISISMPAEYDEVVTNEEELDILLHNRDFISACMSNDNLSWGEKNKHYKRLQVPEFIKLLWEYESYEININPDVPGIHLLKKKGPDNTYSSCKKDILIIARTFADLDQNDKYNSRFVDIQNRECRYKKPRNLRKDLLEWFESNENTALPGGQLLLVLFSLMSVQYQLQNEEHNNDNNIVLADFFLSMIRLVANVKKYSHIEDKIEYLNSLIDYMNA